MKEKLSLMVTLYLKLVLKEYNGYKFICIGKGVLYLNDTEEEIELYNKRRFVKI